MHQGNTTFTTEEIETHVRTYRSLLKSAGRVNIGKLTDSHVGMKSLLHEKAGKKEVDAAAFIYSLLRLPFCMSRVKTVILGQSYSVFHKNGYAKIGRWRKVEAPGRRRKMHYDGRETLAMYIASVTDVDDIVTLLTAFQIEWNKIHAALKDDKHPDRRMEKLIDSSDLNRIRLVFGKDYPVLVAALKRRQMDVTVKLLSGSYMEYSKATKRWWDHVERNAKHLPLYRRPVYFVSSNTHSLVNVLSRYVLSKEKELTRFLYESKNELLISLWEQVEKGPNAGSRENFLFYIAKKYASANPAFLKEKEAHERSLGIITVAPFHYLDINAQLFELRRFADASESLGIDCKHLAASDAVVINIDYPLGWAAYQVLTKIGQNVDVVRGIYLMGKAATLNANIGDILIPTTVFDQHTKNIYAIKNAFTASDFATAFRTGSILDDQKTVSVKGTFLQNKDILAAWYKEGYTTVEMEAGPYMNAVYEFVYYNRYMEQEFINLTTTPFELGIVHYVSDTPNSKGTNLGVRNLAYEGVEATYSATRAIVKKIIEKEKEFV
ncbi:MAG: hypothetical protein UY16_C0019G0005 [Candidatus Gottesmanbacteria bacterium GW2011_GWA2_47_9]|uniref:Uncharacterized protein n=1 Tax=Candidatus Gottesmanbacteria bacterium GW2011_GWA2_47_9 TaxID=1618445 RepID=A0A0G1U132_9BACT|nr:MAG: hypothetical protein UY16_C0019G0005 [Candidatus Gottesmanbacteria bacterium GW2011_GWA2_47_9]